MPNFKMVVSKKYVHTTGTLYAHIRHSEKHHFDMSFEKNIDVPLVCMMYKKCSCGLWNITNKKHMQFSFQRRVARQNRTFLAPCGSLQSLINFAIFRVFLCIVKGGVENVVFSTPHWTFFCRSTYNRRVQIKFFVRELHDICSSEIKTYDISQHF